MHGSFHMGKSKNIYYLLKTVKSNHLTEHIHSILCQGPNVSVRLGCNSRGRREDNAQKYRLFVSI